MNKKKIIYIGLLFILIVISTITYFSYGFLIEDKEYHGKLNVVVGILDYEISSNKLDNNNSITVPPGFTTRFDIEVESLNSIDSKYELYYETNNNDVDINYTSTTVNNPTGTINAKSRVVVSVRIDNQSDSNATVTFRVEGGFTHNNLVLNNVNHIEPLCDNTTTFCISTTNQLITLADEVNNGDSKSGKTYYLENDLDLGGKFDSEGNMLTGSTNWTPIGNYANNKPFSGTFDGDGHIIRNLYINTNLKHQALFGYMSGGTIKKIGIEDSCVISIEENTAMLVSRNHNSTIDSCYTAGMVSGMKNTAAISNAANVNTSIVNCYNKATVSNNSQEFAAGIIGYMNYPSLVSNCYNIGQINGEFEVAGIAGGQQGTINNCYNIGTINTSNHGGGITGQLYTGGSVNNSYNLGKSNNSNYGGIIDSIPGNRSQTLSNNYYLNTSAPYGIYISSNDNFTSQSDDSNASPLPLEQMPTVLSVINGDNAFMEDTYNINNGYPILKWQIQYR